MCIPHTPPQTILKKNLRSPGLKEKSLLSKQMYFLRIIQLISIIISCPHKQLSNLSPTDCIYSMRSGATVHQVSSSWEQVAAFQDNQNCLSRTRGTSSTSRTLGWHWVAIPQLWVLRSLEGWIWLLLLSPPFSQIQEEEKQNLETKVQPNLP